MSNQNSIKIGYSWIKKNINKIKHLIIKKFNEQINWICDNKWKRRVKNKLLFWIGLKKVNEFLNKCSRGKKQENNKNRLNKWTHTEKRREKRKRKKKVRKCKDKTLIQCLNPEIWSCVEKHLQRTVVVWSVQNKERTTPVCLYD